MTLYDLWAKTEPHQSIITHGLVSGFIAQEITKAFLSEGNRKQLSRYLQIENENELLDFIGYFTALHDIGKISYDFQVRDPEMRQRLKAEGLEDIPHTSFRHELESCSAMKEIWRPFERRAARRLAEILGAHHQGKNTQDRQQRARGCWAELQRQYERLMRQKFLHGKLQLPMIRREEEGPLSALLLGIVILSDWIASGEYFSAAESWEDIRKESRMRAAAFLRESGLEQITSYFGHTFHEVWPNIPGGQERELQIKVQQLFSGTKERYAIVLMEAPMGEGKTEAGVYAAVQMAGQWGKNGFYIALPTSATANQMVGRMRRFLEFHHCPENVRLLHAMAWMTDECSVQLEHCSTEEAAYARSWLIPLRRGLLSQYAVGTVDQVMMAAMFIKYGVLRLLGLAGKVLIIDEIHAYDAYMQNILEGLLEWCKALEIPVVLLSATLPPEKKQTLLSAFTKQIVGKAYPAITAVTESGELHELPFQKVAKRQIFRIEKLRILYQPEEIAVAAQNRVKEGGCLCILLNTVKQAQKVYLALKRQDFSGKLLLFHSRFPAERRDEIEKQCLQLFGKDKDKRPKQAILVATQVVEQSLDVDFDFMFSAVAPIDLLIQRMGREFRHEDTPRPMEVTEPVFTVLLPGNDDFQADRYVYPECLLRQTIHLLNERKQIRVPEDIAQLVADGYDTGKVPPEELEQWLETLIEQSVKSASGDKYKLGSPDKKFRPLREHVDFDDLEQQSYLSAKTRLSEPTIRLALVDAELFDRLQTEADNGVLAVSKLALARKILSRSVSIRQKKYEQLVQEYDLSDIEGGKLIIGVRILSLDNPCFEDDRELGLLWKE